MKLFFIRIRYFFWYWGSDYYGERINASFAWALAGAVVPFDEEMRNWHRLDKS